MVRVAVLVGVGDAHAAAVGKLRLPGTLHLQEEVFDGVLDPHQCFCRHLLWIAGSQLCIGPVRHELVAFEAAAQAHAFELRIHIGEVDRDQVVRHAEHGCRVTWRRYATGMDQRFVIAGDQALLAAVGIDQLPGRETCLQEFADLCITGLCAKLACRIASATPCFLHITTQRSA